MRGRTIIAASPIFFSASSAQTARSWSTRLISAGAMPTLAPAWPWILPATPASAAGASPPTFPSPTPSNTRSEVGGKVGGDAPAADAGGTSLIYATYLGGTRDDLAYRVAVDGAGCAYVTGKEASTDFPSTPGALHPGGILQSVDGGGTWSLSSTGLTHPNVRTLIGDPVSPTTLYAGTPRGVFKSVDGGLGWSAFNEGLVSPAVNTLAIDPSAPATLYAG